jgi:hypothetical protein
MLAGTCRFDAVCGSGRAAPARCRQVLDADFYSGEWSEDAVLDLSAQLECEHPSKDLLSFRGRVQLEGAGVSGKQQPVSMSQLLLRGCMLKNSRHVLGAVVYTGDDSRIQQNAAAPPRKIGAYDYFLDVQARRRCAACACTAPWPHCPV